MKFTDFFSQNWCTQRINAIIIDNQLLEATENVYEHVWANIEANDSEIYSFLTEDGSMAYDKMNGQQKSQVETLLHDWIKGNYDYVPGEN